MEIKSVKVDSYIVRHGMFLLNPESQADIEFDEGTHLLITAQSGSRNKSDVFEHKGDLLLRIVIKDDSFFDMYSFTSNNDTSIFVYLEVFKRTKELITVYYSILIEED